MGKKEKELRDNCNSCDKDTPVDKDTAYLVRFTRCFGNFVLNKCVHCGFETRLFTTRDSEEHFIENGIPIAECHEIPEPEFIEQYLDLFEIPLLEEKELTPRQDAKISNWGQFLQYVEVTVEDFERTK